MMDMDFDIEGKTRKIMNNTLRWVKFESVMTAIYGVYGITAPKIELTDHPISLLEHS